jgi:hypothetical protein
MHDRLVVIGAALAARFRPVAVAAVLAMVIGPALGSGSTAEAVSTSAAGLTGGGVEAISCVSAGECTAVGDRTPVNRIALFVVSEKHGVWGVARPVPGLAALLGGGEPMARFNVVSCSSAGNCGAGGVYFTGTAGTQPFVVSERNGIWGTIEKVPGVAPLNTGRDAMTQDMSCSSTGNCGAGGFYVTSRGVTGGFVVSEQDGAWGRARKVGVAGAGISKITCVSPGNCLATGVYGTTGGTFPFTVTQRDGRWGKARTFPRLIALTSGGRYADITSISCKAVGDCTAVGFYYFTSQQDTVFAFRQQNGTWGPVIPVPGIDVLAQDAVSVTIGSLFADFAGVACRSAGNCSAAGRYLPNPGGGSGVYVSTEKNGVWDTAADLPGIATLSGNSVESEPVLSCGAAGDCSLGGSYFSSRHVKPYVAAQKHGIWGSSQHVRGISP